MRKILYIINPISGTRTRKGLQQLVEKETARRNIPFRVISSVANGDYAFLKTKIGEEQITDIVIAGGDGTISQVVGSLLDAPVQFGLLPCGSGNGLALAAGISRKPKQALETIFTGLPKAVDGFLVNKQFSCMLTGLGFDAAVAHQFAHQPKRGLWTYAALISRNFLAARTYRFRIESNGLVFHTDAFFISVANSNQFGNNVTIAPQALLTDGLLDVVIVKKNAKPLLLLNLLRQVFTGKTKRIESSLKLPVIYFQTTELVVDNEDSAPLHIDGDPAETPVQLHIRILPQCFRLIHPR